MTGETAGFGPEVVAEIDRAFLASDREKLVEFARRACVFCTTCTLKGDMDEAKEWAKAYAYLLNLTGETFAGVGDE